MSLTAQTPCPSFARVFHALDTLKAHLASLEQGLALAQQQQQQQRRQHQPYQQQYGHPPGPPPDFGLPPSLTPSPLVLPSAAQYQEPVSPITTSAPLHPHVDGQGYVQAQSVPSVGGPSQQRILAQINAARDAIGSANCELNQAIGALRHSAEDIYERIGSNAALGIPSLKSVDEGCQKRDADYTRDGEKIAKIEKEFNEMRGCRVM